MCAGSTASGPCPGRYACGICIFFFQAEDGIRDLTVTGVQTCALPISINGASNVRRVRSATALGIAVVWVEFDWGMDIFLARQVVAEKLALVGGTLPPQVDRKSVV